MSQPIGAPTFFEVLDAMQRFGGTFIQRLAATWLVADEINRRRLLAAFPDYWREYEAIAIKLALRRQGLD